MDPLTHARNYLEKLPSAISGNNGHDSTFRAACVLVQGFGLPVDAARPLMLEYNGRCQPPWSESEIEHKLQSAESVQDPKGRGYMLTNSKSFHYKYNGDTGRRAIVHQAASTIQPEKPNVIPNKRYHTKSDAEMPEPIEDGARELLLFAFTEGEGVRISIGRTNEEEKDIVKDAGVTLSREEWLRKLDDTLGDPNKILRTSENNGIFIGINPMKIGGTKDSDVTAFRHCLLEFDAISLPEQWSLINQSKIPATAVIYSGGKSLHAWVRVDAKDRAEYDIRVRTLYQHFQDYKPDIKNKNPSRFSRLPNCVRFTKRQELLALSIGCESFTAWQLEQEIDILGQEIRVKDMLEFKSQEDMNNVLGDRWLCKGGACLMIGQSGIGKSSLAMQMAILWSLGKPSFGIETKKPLRSLFIQAENDLGDLSEMFQGVWIGMGLPGEDQPEVIQQVQGNIIIRNVTTLTGYAFCEALRKLIDLYKPDIVWIDPLLSYIGDDISKQAVCSTFMRTWLDPILKATGVVMMLMHHTGKPSKDPKSKSRWTSTDFGYEGLGSSELQNYARAICILIKRDEENYLLQFSKRGKRAGAVTLDSELTSQLWLRHAKKGICWEQVKEPEEKEEGKKNREKIDFNYDEFLNSVKGQFMNNTQMCNRVMKFSGIGKTRAWNEIMPELKERMTFDPELKTYTI